MVHEIPTYRHTLERKTNGTQSTSSDSLVFVGVAAMHVPSRFVRALARRRLTLDLHQERTSRHNNAAG
jgi:hypothetical protein